MGIGVGEIVSIGVSDGLIWFPLVLGVGLLYTYFREIDISVDGIAVLSGIACAAVWRASDSYLWSIVSAVLVGVTCSSIVCGLQAFFRVSCLMAGVVFSLAAHSLSVIFIGESLVMPGTRLLTGFGHIAPWQVVLSLGLAGATILFYSTRFGLAARKLGDGCAVNTVYSAGILRWSAYGVSGLLYGLGGGIYAHSQGLAKSGGGFEFLLVALCAFLCMTRLAQLIDWALRGLRKGHDGEVQSLSTGVWVLRQVVSSPAVKAIVGAIFFETLLFFTIVVSPNPMLWKLLFALLLLMALLSPRALPRIFSRRVGRQHGELLLGIRGLSVHYDIGSERRQVFRSASADFREGINLVRGPNGTGKSTLLKMIAGVVDHAEGVIDFGGRDLMHVAQHERPVFLIQQNPMETLAPDLTVAESVFVSTRGVRPWALGHRPKEAVKRLIGRLRGHGVEPIKPEDDSFWDKPIVTLSGGEAHCVALYCALMADSQILLADEPTPGLDAANFGRLTALLQVLAHGRIVIVTSHDTRMADVAHRHFAVGGGQILLVSETAPTA